MDVAAFVPMKAHSERVPGKNLRLLAGRPLYHWIVRSLVHVDRVTRIVINTDSERIADDIDDHFRDVEVLERPEHLRGDMVPMHDIIRHDAAQVGEPLLLQTHATNPFLRPETIKAAIEAFESGVEYDSLFSVTALQTRLYSVAGQPLNHDPRVLLRTQDLEPVYEENSCLYVFTPAVIEGGFRTGDRPLLFPIAADEALDIDAELDFRIAECLAPDYLRGPHA